MGVGDRSRREYVDDGRAGDDFLTVKTYSCHRHHDRGSAVCAITIHQPIEEVETLLIDHIREHVLTPEMLDAVLANVRAEIEAQMPQHDADLKALEAELGDMKAEQKRLAKAVAISNDIPELMTELKQRLNRINHLETQIAAAKRTPAERAKLIVQLEKTVKARLVDVRAALSDRRDLREILMALFPSGLQFTPARTSDGARQVWKMRGAANYKALDCARRSPVQSESGPGSKGGSGSGTRNRADSAELVSWFNPNCDPDGIRTRVTGVKGRCPRPSGRRGLVLTV
jgi:hypothetical protein